MQHACESTLVQHNVIEREPAFAAAARPVDRLRLELHPPLGEVITSGEAAQRELCLVATAAREKAEPSEIDAENRHGPSAEEPSPTKQGPIAAERKKRVDLRARLEASGGLTLDRAREVALTGVDLIAVGALTHSAPVLDIAMDLRA